MILELLSYVFINGSLYGCRFCVYRLSSSGRELPVGEILSKSGTERQLATQMRRSPFSRGWQECTDIGPSGRCADRKPSTLDLFLLRDQHCLSMAS